MEQIALKASLREGNGKQLAGKLRKQGSVPGIVYHRGEQSVPISLNEKELLKILRSAGGENVLISLSIEGSKKKSRPVLIKEIQHHPVKRNVLHVDFNEISLNEKITVEVEVVSVGEAIGVKQDGGVLEHVLREVKVTCLPTDIPKHIDVDVSGLKLNEAVHVSDLKLDAKIQVLTPPEMLLFQVKLPVEQKIEEPGVAAETPELEVIREKKEEPGAAGEKKAEPPAGGGSAAGGKAEKAEKPEKK